jgi:hypothetical protein
MYAGFITPKHASNWLGAHQKLDRLAYFAMRRFVLVHNEAVHARGTLAHFPSLKSIHHFEGVNGPDGIKLKSPGHGEPSYAYNPRDTSGVSPLLTLLQQHLAQLQEALKDENDERAAFEASWLAHTIVDGLTPAHHYPYEEELEVLRGEGNETRDTKTKKMLIKGSTASETLKKNWQFLGAKGLLTTHQNFEMGVASTLLPLRLRGATPSILEAEYAKEHGLVEVFQITARSIADLRLYERFYETGWTVLLTRDVRTLLLPQMVKTISLAWLLALESDAPQKSAHRRSR